MLKSFHVWKTSTFIDAKYIKYELNEILWIQLPFCHITKGVKYAPNILRISITFDFLAIAKNDITKVKINETIREVISGIRDTEASLVRDQ